MTRAAQTQLKIIKTHALALAKAEWYEWKSAWIEELQLKSEAYLRDLDEVASRASRCAVS